MLHDAIEKQIPQLARGRVWCCQCGKTQHVDSADAMRNGWPKCCGYTMTIDSQEEQKTACKDRRTRRMKMESAMEGK